MSQKGHWPKTEHGLSLCGYHVFHQIPSFGITYVCSSWLTYSQLNIYLGQKCTEDQKSKNRSNWSKIGQFPPQSEWVRHRPAHCSLLRYRSAAASRVLKNDTTGRYMAKVEILRNLVLPKRVVSDTDRVPGHCNHPRWRATCTK